MSSGINKDPKMKSRYADDLMVPPHVFIAEYVCENMAIKNGTDLVPYFWRIEGWGKTFGLQAMYANRLLKDHSPKKIIHFITTRRIWSLRPKWVREELEKLPPMEDKIEEEELVKAKEATAGRIKKTKKTMLEGLK